MITTKKKYRVSDYMNLSDDKRYEVIFGELVLAPSPDSRHQEVVVNLCYKLKDYTNKGTGKVLVAPMDVILDDENVVQPDIIFISQANQKIIKDRIYGVPDLLIEVISTDEARDRIVKKDLYERFGVKEYWVADKEKKEIEVYVLKDKKYTLRGIYTIEDNITSTVANELQVNLRDIFVEN